MVFHFPPISGGGVVVITDIINKFTELGNDVTVITPDLDWNGEQFNPKINSKIKDYSNLEKFVASLWDFGLKVGHSVRTEKEIKKIITSDIKEFTSYLSLRPLSADKRSLEIMQKILAKKEKIISN